MNQDLYERRSNVQEIFRDVEPVERSNGNGNGKVYQQTTTTSTDDYSKYKSWGMIIVAFIIIWLLILFGFWVSEADWTRNEDGEADGVKMAAVAAIFAIVVCLIIAWRT